MDHVVVALLNSASEVPDPLDSALGAARWWSSVNAQRPQSVTVEGKPRFDAALAAALRSLRGSLAVAIEGGTASVTFTGTAADRILFQIATAAMEIFAGHRGRIKRCAGCPLLFLDATKNRSRRWCSLRCMEKSRCPRRRTIAK
ncbi:MAG TPA: CGNR zinc finger domain-containing protein [Candidatus Baltobacteraceae bacterium]|nr:CGNR zinc finger domain-containing protein [Candidatus Baltobacteraceae bacterium]